MTNLVLGGECVTAFLSLDELGVYVEHNNGVGETIPLSEFMRESLVGMNANTVAAYSNAFAELSKSFAVELPCIEREG